jgi:hypothetical protein
VFSREDVDDEGDDSEGTEVSQTLIRVTNTRHSIFTHWTVAKLEEKIIQMRDLYQVCFFMPTLPMCEFVCV